MSDNYSCTQKTQSGGKKMLRKVTIKNGKGYKSVTYYKKGKRSSTIKKPLNSIEIATIKVGKFIPGLFKSCSCNKTKKKKY